MLLVGICIRAKVFGIANAFDKPVRRLVRVNFLDADADLLARVQGVDLVSGALVEAALFLERVFKRVAMGIGTVLGVARVFLALQPVAIEFHDGDLADRIGPDEQVPLWQIRRW